MKVFLSLASITLYMGSYMYIQFMNNQALYAEQIDSCKEQQDISSPISALQQYREMEICVFYSQVLSLFLYVASSRLFMWVKMKHRGENMGKDDPFWYLLIYDQNDFLANENQIMLCTTL